MTTPDTRQADEPDPIDAEAAQIDPRSAEAPEAIEELVEHATALGRDADAKIDPDAPSP